MGIEQNHGMPQPPSIQGAAPVKQSWLSSQLAARAKRKDENTTKKIEKLQSGLAQAIASQEPGKISKAVVNPSLSGSKIISTFQKILNTSRAPMTSAGYAAEVMRLEHSGVSPEKTKELYKDIETLRKNEIIAAKEEATKNEPEAIEKEIRAIDTERTANAPIKSAIKEEEAAEAKRKATPLSNPIKWLAARKEWKAARSKREDALANWEPTAKALNAAKRERAAITLAKEQPIPVIIDKDKEAYKAAVTRERAAILKEKTAIVNEKAAKVKADAADFNVNTAASRANIAKTQADTAKTKLDTAKVEKAKVEAVIAKIDADKLVENPKAKKEEVFVLRDSQADEVVALLKQEEVTSFQKLDAAKEDLQAKTTDLEAATAARKAAAQERITATQERESLAKPLSKAVVAEAVAETASQERITATQEKDSLEHLAEAEAQGKDKALVYSDKDKESIQKLINKAIPETVSLRHEAHKVNNKIKATIANGTFDPQFIKDLTNQQQKLEHQKQILEKGNKFVNNKEINEQIQGLERAIQMLDRSIKQLEKMSDVNRTSEEREESIRFRADLVKNFIDNAKNLKQGGFHEARVNLIEARKQMISLKEEIDYSPSSFAKARLQEKYLKPLEQEFADLRPPVPSIAFKDARESPFHLTEREKSLVSDLSAALSPSAVAEVMKRYSPEQVAEVHDRLQMDAFAFSPLTAFGDSRRKRDSTNDFLGKAAMIEERISLLPQSKAKEIINHMELARNPTAGLLSTDYQNIATAAHWLATAKSLDTESSKLNSLQKARMQYRCWQECTEQLTVLRQQMKNEKNPDLRNATKKMIGDIQGWRGQQLRRSNPEVFSIKGNQKGSGKMSMSLDQMEVMENTFLKLQDQGEREGLEHSLLENPESNKRWLTWLKNNEDFTIEKNIQKLFGVEPFDRVSLGKLEMGDFVNEKDGITKVIRFLAADGLGETREPAQESLKKCFSNMQSTPKGQSMLVEMRKDKLVESIYQQVMQGESQPSVLEIPALKKTSPQEPLEIASPQASLVKSSTAAKPESVNTDTSADKSDAGLLTHAKKSTESTSSEQVQQVQELVKDTELTVAVTTEKTSPTNRAQESQTKETQEPIIKETQEPVIKAQEPIIKETQEQNAGVRMAAGKFLSKLKKPRTHPKTEGEVSKTTEIEQIRADDEAAMRRVQGEIDAVREGHRVRNAVVLPSQIMGTLKDHFKGISEKNLDKLAKIICREVNEMTLDPDNHKGTSKLISAHKSVHAFPVLTDENLDKPKGDRAREEVRFDYDCWLEMMPNGKEFRVFIKDNTLLGTGSYKDVFGAHNLELSLEVQERQKGIASRKGNIQPEVFVRLRNGNNPDDDSLSDVREGLEVQRVILEKIKEQNVEANLTSLPIERLGVEGASDESRMEWYNGDLAHAIDDGVLPLGFQHTSSLGSVTNSEIEMSHVTRADKAKVLLDAARALHAMHQVGVVHCDVKPPNLLVKIDKTLGMRGFLSDFDLATSPSSVSQKGIFYEYWDKCRSVEGLVTPFTDCYGLAATTGEALLGKKFLDNYRKPGWIEKEDNQQDVMNDAVVGIWKEGIGEAFKGVKDSEIRTKLVEMYRHNDLSTMNETIDAFIKDNADSLSQDDIEKMNRIKDKTEAIRAACDLVFESVKKSAEVFDYFMVTLSSESPEDFAALKASMSENPDIQGVQLLEKQRIIAKCSEALGGYSMDQMRGRLEEIYKKLS